MNFGDPKNPNFDFILKDFINHPDLKNLYQDVKKTYPDLRRAINILQSNSVKGKLTLSEVIDSNYIEQVIDELKSKKKTAFNNIRQIIANNNINDFFIKQIYKHNMQYIYMLCLYI